MLQKRSQLKFNIVFGAYILVLTAWSEFSEKVYFFYFCFYLSLFLQLYDIPDNEMLSCSDGCEIESI